MILPHTRAALLLPRSARGFPRPIAGAMIGLALLFGDHTHRLLVTWALEDTEQDLEHLQNVTIDEVHLETIIGDADRHHHEQHPLGLLLALRHDDLLHQSILIVLVWPDLDLDHLHTLHLERLIRVYYDPLFRERDLLHDANDHRRGRSRLLAALSIELVRHLPHVRNTGEVMGRLRQVNPRLDLLVIAMATTAVHLQVGHPAATAKHHKCLLQLALRTHPCPCLRIIAPILLYWPLLLVHAVPRLADLMDPLEISLHHRLGEVDMEVHRQGQRVMV